MADLTAVTTTRLEKGLLNAQVVASASSEPSNISADRLDDVETLRNSPSYEEFSEIVHRLASRYEKDGSIQPKGAAARSKVIGLLVTDCIPNFWSTFSAAKDARSVQLRGDFLTILRTTSGLGAIVAQIKASNAVSRGASASTLEASSLKMKTYFELLDWLLRGSQTLSNILSCLSSKDADTRELQNYVLLQWKELLSILCGSRLLSSTMEAIDIFKDTDLATLESTDWLVDPERYTVWIADNLTSIISLKANSGNEKLVQELLSRAVAMRRPDIIAERLLFSSAVKDTLPISNLRSTVAAGTNNVQRSLLVSVVRTLSSSLFEPTFREYKVDWWKTSQNTVMGTAEVYSQLGEGDLILDTFSNALTDSSLAEVQSRINAQRAILARLSSSPDHVTQIFERSLKDFGDKLYIKHTPIFNQEVKAQIILLAAGHIHRWKPNALKKFVRSSIYLNSVSNRLSASSETCRYLGMVVGETISSLVDTNDGKLKWDSEELRSSPMLWLKSLVLVDDKAESSAAFTDRLKEVFTADGRLRRSNLKPSYKEHVQSRTKEAETVKPYEIEEPEDDTRESRGLRPYAKPDSDPEDEDEDPTLVQRQKPTAPVYIRNLLKNLQETENYDIQRLALSVAAPLIQRKANFGTELRDDAEELAATLAGLKDKFDMKDFQEMRLRAMIALVVAIPELMGPWFARTLFQGDYSVAQRSTVLASIGFAAREIAGYGKEDSHLTKARPEENPFPSKRLPEKLHKVYNPHRTAIDTLVSGLERAMIEPKALSAADKLSGPDILKVRTFSSRMQVEKTRQKAVPNKTSGLIATAVFFPLTSGWHANLKAFGGRGVHFDPFLLTSFIKTLSLIFHAAGASSPYLKQMTTEFWDLLLSLRMQSEITVLEALLFGFLTLLETNQQKRDLVEEHSRELLETQEWASKLFDSTSAASSGREDENERLRMLTASVLLHTKDVIQKYERMLVGQLTEY